MLLRPPRSTRTDTLFPYPTLFRSIRQTSRRIGRDVPAGAALSTCPRAGREACFSRRVDQHLPRRVGMSGPQSAPGERKLGTVDDITQEERHLVPFMQATLGNGLQDFLVVGRKLGRGRLVVEA